MAQRKIQQDPQSQPQPKPQRQRERLNDLTLGYAYEQGLENMVVSVSPAANFPVEEVTIIKIERFAGRTDKDGKMIQPKKNVFLCWFSGRQDPINLSGSHPVIKADRGSVDLG